MNEAETRAELIDPLLKESGWGVSADSKILREYKITLGRLSPGGIRVKPLIADYVLVYKGEKLAVIEAKSSGHNVNEGVAQAKLYASRLNIDFTYSTNGREIYGINMLTGTEGLIKQFPTPEKLWALKSGKINKWLSKFKDIPFENMGGTKDLRYYQEIAVNNTIAAIAGGKNRILLTLATGTGKTFIAFQIAWKLFQSRWCLNPDGQRLPRILFLADRNILADQAFNDFSAFPEDAMVRIKPNEIQKKKRIPFNGSIFFTIFQTFMSGTDNTGKPAPYFGGYPKDFFDFIIIDECHRGGADDESTWRSIMDYFSPAVQLGLTATPKRKDNVDTYKYFGDPVYVYSLKQGVEDGFLTPFKVKRFHSTIDDYVYTSDDEIIEGEVEEGKIYTTKEFNKVIEIKKREEYRVKVFLKEINQNEKSIVFCATQLHAAIVRDLVNQYSDSKDPFYCVRVTANDGLLGEQYLRDFRDNEKTIPTILTTSQKLSTGVDARNIRNIILMRPVNTMIEFKQIIGRGTRLFEGKEFFTIIDFDDAYMHFFDPDWDGEPISGQECPKCGQYPCVCEKAPRKPCPICGQIPCICVKRPPKEKRTMVKIKLKDGKEREIKHISSTSYWGPDGKPITAEQFLTNLFGVLPDFFTSEKELREIWSMPASRKKLLERLAGSGFGKEEFKIIQNLIDAEKSDLFDILGFIAYASRPITREQRVEDARAKIFLGLDEKKKEFIAFVLDKYIETGVEELDQEKLPVLLKLKYNELADAMNILGPVEGIKNTFINFQQHLYKE